MDFELKNLEENSNLNIVWILKRSKTFGKNLIHSQKFYLLMVFLNMNLDWLTCIQEFDVSFTSGKQDLV
jgi:hypothetical protein